MKTLTLIIGLLSLPHLAAANQSGPDQQLRVFANCVGQLSATMEYQWMFDGPASDVTQAQRAVMIELVQAIMAPDQGRDVLQWRVSAKLAHSALLTRATFNDDHEDAAWALALADQRVSECASLLLS